ncbi:MAG: type I restriction enzyme HsdR N-terminal domain-containing protein [Leptolyngbyaceae cyanobacterium RU_5_1]|nr:type I restriction enzyme HsdR N-terminal domain-containing protein [Leptolyngbyaceae cyanobacterium RU_5_1]
MQAVDASKLTLRDVHRLLHLEEQLDKSQIPALPLEPLTEAEQQDLSKIRADFRRYLLEEKISEGLVKFLSLAPLLRLTGFYDVPIRLTMETSLEIIVEDEDTKISGRLDLLALSSVQYSEAGAPFWALVIETKNSSIEVRQGLPQLLTYAHKSLNQQPIVWGVVTNGLQFLFVRLQKGNLSTYHLLPELYLLDEDRSLKLVQVLKALCKLQFGSVDAIAV